MAFATASSPANRKPGDNAQTATPPQAQARPRQSPGNAEPPTRARAPACARARQRAPGPQRMPGPRRVLGRKPSSGALTEPSIGLPNVDRAKRQALVALAKPSPQRASPRRAPGRNRAPERKPSRAARSRSISQAGPQRTPTPPMHARTKTGLRSVTQAEQRVPAARESPFLSSRGQKKRFFADSGPKHAILRAIGRPIRGQTTKTSISHFRDREKPSVLTASDQN